LANSAIRHPASSETPSEGSELLDSLQLLKLVRGATIEARLIEVARSEKPAAEARDRILRAIGVQR